MEGLKWVVKKIDIEQERINSYLLPTFPDITAEVKLLQDYCSPVFNCRHVLSPEYLYEELNHRLGVNFDMEKKTRKPEIKRVIFNDPATIIIWNDGTKTVVKCQGGEEFDPEKGFVMAYLKKLLGNDNTFNKEIRKWV